MRGPWSGVWRSCDNAQSPCLGQVDVGLAANLSGYLPRKRDTPTFDHTFHVFAKLPLIPGLDHLFETDDHRGVEHIDGSVEHLPTDTDQPGELVDLCGVNPEIIGQIT